MRLHATVTDAIYPISRSVQSCAKFLLCQGQDHVIRSIPPASNSGLLQLFVQGVAPHCIPRLLTVWYLPVPAYSCTNSTLQ